MVALSSELGGDPYAVVKTHFKCQSQALNSSSLPLNMVSSRSRISGSRGGNAGSARVSVNGQAVGELPAFMQPNSWQKSTLAEFEVDEAMLKRENEITFSLKPGGTRYAAIVTTLLTQERVSARPARNNRPIGLDVASANCVVTGEESWGIPEWYAKKTAAMPLDLPPALAC